MLDLIVIFFVGMFASFIGVMVGGGGLISIATLILLGLPPQAAIATNKFGGLGATGGSIPKFYFSGKIIWSYVWKFMILAVMGSFIGAKILISVNDEFLLLLVGLLILSFVPLSLLLKEIGVKRKKVSKTKEGFGYFLLTLNYIFAGFFGGGSGTIMRFVHIYFFGFTLNESSATMKIPNFTLMVFSLIILSFAGLVDFRVGIPLCLGSLVGGWFGAHTAIKKGDAWVKALFVVVCLVLAIKLLFF